MSTHDNDYRPMGGDLAAPRDASGIDPVLDPRAVRPREPRGPRMVRWGGCPFVSVEEVAEVPAGADLRLRIGVFVDGEEVWFERKPFPISVKPADLHKRFGPGTYVVQLVAVDPTAPGSGIRATVYTKHVEIRARGEADVGREAWPVNTSSAETPRALIDEMDRRAQIRGDVGDGYDANAGGYGGYGAQQGYAPNAYLGARRGGTEAQNYEEEEEDEYGPRDRPPEGFAWTRLRGRWVLVQADEAEEEDYLAQRGGRGRRGGSVGSFLGTLLDRPVEESLALVAGGMKLFKEIFGAGQSADAAKAAADAAKAAAEAERMRVEKEFELRKLEIANQQQTFLKQLEVQQAARPVAPLVDPEAIRRQALAEARAEAMQKELSRLAGELQTARSAKVDPPPDVVTQIQRVKQQAEALGLLKNNGGPTPPASFLEQMADLLATPGGAAIAEKLATKALGLDAAPAPPAPAPPAPAQMPQPQQPHGLGQGYGGPQYEGDPGYSGEQGYSASGSDGLQ